MVGFPRLSRFAYVLRFRKRCSTKIFFSSNTRKVSIDYSLVETGKSINELRKKREANCDGELWEILDKILRFLEILGSQKSYLFLIFVSDSICDFILRKEMYFMIRDSLRIVIFAKGECASPIQQQHFSQLDVNRSILQGGESCSKNKWTRRVEFLREAGSSFGAQKSHRRPVLFGEPL